MRSRWRDPDPTRGPDPKTFPLERDLAILKRLDIRRFEALNWLHYFIGGEYTAFCQRLGQLFDGGYIGRVKEHLHHDTVHARHLIYFLTDKGRRVLGDHGIQPVFKTTKQYLHECQTSFVWDGLEYGAGERGFNFIGWDMGASSATARSAHSRPEANVRLMELVVSRENMMAAHARVVGNKGAAGIDKMSVADLKPFLKEHWPRIEKSCWKTGISHNPCAGWRSPSPGAGCAG